MLSSTDQLSNPQTLCGYDVKLSYLTKKKVSPQN